MYHFNNKTGVDYISDDVEHVVYDLSIQDVDQRREKANRFPSARHVATFLGVTPGQVFNNRLPGQRIWSDVHCGYFAVRTGKHLTTSKTGE
jgi:hypothetical protein